MVVMLGACASVSQVSRRPWSWYQDHQPRVCAGGHTGTVTTMTQRAGTASRRPTQPAGRSTGRHHELGTFLRARREATVPEEVGYTSGTSRRTPGLRREEVAALAGVGVTWYTWLEQGRAVNASEQVLSAVARALLLDESETTHLFSLAGARRRVDDTREQCAALSPGVHPMLAQLDPLPAVIQNGRYDILAVNPAYSGLIGVDIEAIPDEDRNSLYQALTNERWRAALADWPTLLPIMAAQFRALMAEHLSDPLWTGQLDKFRAASPEFVDAWSHHEVRVPASQVKRFHHPDVGLLTLAQTSWWVAPRLGARMLVYTPVDDAGREALAELRRARPAA